MRVHALAGAHAGEGRGSGERSRLPARGENRQRGDGRDLNCRRQERETSISVPT